MFMKPSILIKRTMEKKALKGFIACILLLGKYFKITEEYSNELEVIQRIFNDIILSFYCIIEFGGL